MRPGGFSFKEAAAGDGPGFAGGEGRFSRTRGLTPPTTRQPSSHLGEGNTPPSLRAWGNLPEYDIYYVRPWSDICRALVLRRRSGRKAETG